MGRTERRLGRARRTVRKLPFVRTSRRFCQAEPQAVSSRIVKQGNGLRFDNDKSYIEAGYEVGGVLGSPLSFTFNPGTPNSVPCAATGAEQKGSLGSCVKSNSTPPSGLIVPTSTFSETTRLLFENGLFLNFKLNVPLPLNNSLTYTMESHGQFLFNHKGDVSVDTKYQEDWTHSLTVPLFGNLSFVPKLEIFFFQNKVDRHFFYAIQPSVALQYSFDWHNGLPWWKSMMYQTPSASSASGGSSGSTGAAAPTSPR